MLNCLPKFWKEYYDEVVFKKLHYHEGTVKKMLEDLYIGVFSSLQNQPINHLIRFHIYLYEHHLDIFRVERALKPIELVHQKSGPIENEQEQIFIEDKNNLSCYIVHKLFAFLSNQPTGDIGEWFKCYHNIVRTIIIKKYSIAKS